MTELEGHFISKGEVDPLVLSSEYYISDKRGVKIDVTHDFNRAAMPGQRLEVQGTRLKISVPYEGDGDLWRLRPSTTSISGYPEIAVDDQTVTLTVEFPDDSPRPDDLRRRIERDVQALADAVASQRREIGIHNERLRTAVPRALEARINKAAQALGAIEALGIPMKRAEEAPIYVLPSTRRKTPTVLPPVETEEYSPEPVLHEDEYQHILRVMRSMSLVMERSPRTFSALDEEAIRTHFLIQLNGHYEGGATGETFNAAGKTDILIRHGDRNVFIAECKFWRGPKAFDEAISQLLGYLTWRDSKAAILVFNRSGKSSGVRRKMHEAMEACKEHRKTALFAAEGDSRYVLVKANDPGREIIVTTMIFDVPAQEG